LRRDGPVKAPRGGIRRKFFSRGKSGRVGVAEPAKKRTNDDARACCRLQKQKFECRKNPHYIGTSALRRISNAPSLARKNFRRGVLPAIAMRVECASGARHLHTKLNGITVIFFLL
jgi:hypothetical protein